MKAKRGLRVGLALGGGAARGLAHIGVYKTLRENGVPIHALGGVSIGSLIAAGFAAGMSPEDLREIAHSTRWRDLGSWSFDIRGLNTNERMDDWLAQVLPVDRFEDLEIPLLIVATDLQSGEPIVLSSGPLFPAIRASCAIPGLYTPVELNGRLLADGYLTCNLPVRQLRRTGLDVVLASAIGLEVSPQVKLNNIYQILLRAFSIMSATVQTSLYKEADVTIRPEVEGYSWTDLEAVDILIKSGEKASLEALPEIRRALNPGLLSRVRWNPFRRPGPSGTG